PALGELGSRNAPRASNRLKHDLVIEPVDHVVVCVVDGSRQGDRFTGLRRGRARRELDGGRAPGAPLDVDTVAGSVRDRRGPGVGPGLLDTIGELVGRDAVSVGSPLTL